MVVKIPVIKVDNCKTKEEFDRLPYHIKSETVRIHHNKHLKLFLEFENQKKILNKKIKLLGPETQILQNIMHNKEFEKFSVRYLKK